MRVFYPLLTIAGILGITPSLSMGSDYTYRNGYYWNAGKAYSRSQVYYPTTYSYVPTYSSYSYNNGCYSSSYPTYSYVANSPTYYYLYTEVPVAYPESSYETPKPSTYSSKSYGDGGWRTQLLEIAKARDVAEHAMRKMDLDHRNYVEALGALGMSGNFRMQGYGSYNVQPRASVPYLQQYTPEYGYTRSYNNTNYSYGYPAQGATTYGYSVNTLKDQYGTTDLNSLYQQASRLAQNSQSLAGQATTDFQGLAGDAGQNAARVAEILAKAQAASIALQAANAPPSTRSSTTATSTITTRGGVGTSEGGGNGAGVGGGVNPTTVAPGIDPNSPPVPAMLPADGSNGGGITSPASGRGNGQAFLANVGIPRCGQCHDPKNGTIKGSFNILQYTQLSPDQKRGVWQKILSTDPKQVMPPPPHKTLTGPELQAFLMN